MSVRLLSSHLMLELEVQGRRCQEKKVYVKWGRAYFRTSWNPEAQAVAQRERLKLVSVLNASDLDCMDVLQKQGPSSQS